MLPQAAAAVRNPLQLVYASFRRVPADQPMPDELATAYAIAMGKRGKYELVLEELGVNLEILFGKGNHTVKYQHMTSEQIQKWVEMLEAEDRALSLYKEKMWMDRKQ